jgi:hypothetical protein
MKKLIFVAVVLLAATLILSSVEAKSFYKLRLEAGQGKSTENEESTDDASDDSSENRNETNSTTGSPRFTGGKLSLIKDEYKVREKVFCKFENSQMVQKCWSNLGKCSGIKQCSVFVASKDLSKKGIELSWKSTCPGDAKTTLDGADETVTFKCETTTCIKGEYRLTGLNEGHYYGAERCNGVKWVTAK